MWTYGATSWAWSAARRITRAARRRVVTSRADAPSARSSCRVWRPVTSSSRMATTRRWCVASPGWRERSPAAWPSCGSSGPAEGCPLDAQLRRPRAVSAQVPEHADGQVAREEVVGDALHVVGLHLLDALEDLVQAEAASEVDLLAGQVAHAAARV